MLRGHLCNPSDQHVGQTASHKEKHVSGFKKTFVSTESNWDCSKIRHHRPSTRIKMTYKFFFS